MSASKSLYLKVWLVLLGLTAVMIILDRSPVGTAILRTVLVTAMLTKAGLIAAYFMHLRFERVALVMTVLIGLLVTGAVLFLFIIPDASRILSLSTA
jgi:cytochrome c oxidase subunit 4